MIRRLGGAVCVAAMVVGLSACLPGTGGTECGADDVEPNDAPLLATEAPTPTPGNDVVFEASLDPCLGVADVDYFVVTPPPVGDGILVSCSSTLPEQANLYRVDRVGARLSPAAGCHVGGGWSTASTSTQPQYYEVSWTGPTQTDYTITFKHES